jgi:hypothetical protein
MSCRIAKIDQHAVAAELRDEAAVTFHNRQRKPLILQLQIPQVLGIQLLRQLCVADKVAKKNRQVTTLRYIGPACPTRPSRHLHALRTSIFKHFIRAY